MEPPETKIKHSIWNKIFYNRLLKGRNKFAKIIISAENLFKKKMSYETILHSEIQFERYKKNIFTEEFVQPENMLR